MRPLFLFALAAAATGAFAQSAPAPKDKSLYISAEELQKIMQAVPAAPDGKPGSFSKRLFTASTFSDSFIRLNAPDTPHAHGAWSEVFIVKEGAGILETGGKITGVTGHDSATHKSIFVDPPAQAQSQAGAARHADEGDLAGTGIEGGHSDAVKAGDVILIPAGVAHRWLKVDSPVVYFDIKFPKAQ